MQEESRSWKSLIYTINTRNNSIDFMLVITYFCKRSNHFYFLITLIIFDQIVIARFTSYHLLYLEPSPVYNHILPNPTFNHKKLSKYYIRKKERKISGISIQFLSLTKGRNFLNDPRLQEYNNERWIKRSQIKFFLVQKFLREILHSLCTDHCWTSYLTRRKIPKRISLQFEERIWFYRQWRLTKGP